MTKKSIFFIKIGMLILITFFGLILIVNEQRKIEIPHPEIRIPKAEEIDLNKCVKLSENCLTEECFYFEQYCKWASLIETIEKCSVYQCPEEKHQYVSEVKFKDSKAEIKRGFPKEKTSQEIEKEITPFLEKCKGKIEVLDNKDCSKYKIKVKTTGDCKISAFMGTFDNKNYQSFTFSKEQDFYILTIPDCQNLKELIAVGERGILIK